MNTFGTPGQSAQKDKRADTTIRPIMLQQLAQLSQVTPDSPHNLDGFPVANVRVIVRILGRSATSTMDSFTAADQTGGTEIKRWINVDAVNQDDFQEGDYVVVTGAVKQFGQKVSIIAVGMHKMESPDQLSHHMEKVMHTLATLRKKQGTAQGTNNPTSAYNSHFSRLQNEIIDLVKKTNAANVEAYIPDLIKRLKGVASEPEIRREIDGLVNEGNLYNTLDDDHVSYNAM